MLLFDEKYAYYYISVIIDQNTCEECKKLDNFYILNDKSQMDLISKYENGITECSSSKGCRCMLVAVCKDEVGSDIIVDKLKKAGGSGFL